MTQSRTARDAIYLAACAVNGTVPEADRVRTMDLDAVYALAARHLIGAVIAYALESAGVRDSRSAAAIASAMRKTALFERAWNDIKSQMEARGIWYMPLKGAVLKSYYPKYGMREFADHDILFDATRAGDVRAVMEGLGFTTERFGTSNHDIYHKPPVLNFEMHSALFGPSHDEKLYEYYRNVEDRLLGEGCEKRFSPEDFYLYFLAHEYKHYSGGGTGLRSLLDTYILLNRAPLNMNYVAAEAERLGIAEFEQQNRALALRLLGGEALSEADGEMLDYMLSSGTYGTINHRVENRMRKHGWGKLRYMLVRFSVPVSKKNRSYAAFAGMYPLFYKHKLLLPLLPFYRTFRAMRAGRFKREAQAIRQVK